MFQEKNFGNLKKMPEDVFYETIAHQVFSWVTEVISLTGDVLMNIDIIEHASGATHIQVECLPVQ